MRLSDKGEPYVLEVNPNPDITRGSGLEQALTAAGITYDTFIATLISNAMSRQRTKRPVRRAARRAEVGGDYLIRQTVPADRGAVRRMLDETGFFRPDEIIVAMEVFDDALKGGPEGPYRSFTLDCEGAPAGWVCFGPTACTVGTFDVYWIAVSPRYQAKGFGTALLAHAEKLIKECGGRISVIETSGRKIYHPTRQFYLRKGYEEAARLKDFYASDDDKVVYTKVLS
jgi:GNAT superfamily N-acetyltransferase